MSEIRSQATPARDELAEAIKGYGKSFLGECEEADRREDRALVRLHG